MRCDFGEVMPFRDPSMGLATSQARMGSRPSTASSVAPDITVCLTRLNPVALQPGSLYAGVQMSSTNCALTRTDAQDDQ